MKKEVEKKPIKKKTVAKKTTITKTTEKKNSISITKGSDKDDAKKAYVAEKDEENLSSDAENKSKLETIKEIQDTLRKHFPDPSEPSKKKDTRTHIEGVDFIRPNSHSLYYLR